MKGVDFIDVCSISWTMG